MTPKWEKLTSKLSQADAKMFKEMIIAFLAADAEGKAAMRISFKPLSGSDPDKDGDNDTDHPDETGE